MCVEVDLDQWFFVCLYQWFLNISVHQIHPEDLLKHHLLGSSPRVSDSLGLSLSLIICISNNFLSDSDGAGPGTTL